MINLKYLEDFALKRIFDFSYVIELTGDKDLASRTIQNYLDKGYIKRVKHNLYVSISLENGGVIPNRFEIASNITKNSFVSHQSAFEFYGFKNQIYNEVLVSSKEQFRNFSFEYKEYVCKRVNDIEFIEIINGVKVSSLAKTIVDSIDEVKTYDDFEELIEVLSMIPLIDGKKILDYLKHVDKKTLYSKTGLVLSFFKDDYNITENQLKEMKESGVKKAEYFTKEKHRLNKYYKEWKIHSYDIFDLRLRETNENV